MRDLKAGEWVMYTDFYREAFGKKGDFSPERFNVPYRVKKIQHLPSGGTYITWIQLESTGDKLHKANRFRKATEGEVKEEKLKRVFRPFEKI